MEYKYVAVGGTFDQFHVGHEALLDKAFQIGKRVLIGLTTDGSKLIEPFDKRKKNVEEFVKKYGKKYEIFPLKDEYGPTVEDENFDAIVATTDTKETCEKINEIRRKKAFKPLDIIIVPFVYSEDCRKISSERVKKGEIDRNGKVLVDYYLTDKLRKEFEKPVNPIFEGENEPMTEILISYIKSKGITNVISIGDEVSRDLLKHGFKPKNVIIDGRVKQLEVGYKDFILKHYPHNFSVNNPPGVISKEVWRVMRDAFKIESAIFVNGEEDILTYPAALLAENNSVIIYGQPYRGKVIVKVDEEKKEKLRKKLEEFEIIHQ